MVAEKTIYDPALADGRFQLETLALRWVLVGLYALLTGVGVIDVPLVWFAVSEGFLVAYHIYYTWYTWHELTQDKPLPPQAAYATPFLDAVAVSATLIAIGDPLHPIWSVYFFIIVGVAFFYYPVIREFGIWLAMNYAVVGLVLTLRGVDVMAPHMIVAGILLVAGTYNLSTYTGGERRLRDRMSEVARTDPLTRLRNRRGLEESLEVQLASATEGSGLAVLMIDVDRFKRYNDQFGHLVADRVLEQLGEVLSAAVREPELVSRYGGDEFVVLLPGVSSEEAMRLAERLCDQVARTGLCTISLGVSVSFGEEMNATVLVDRADSALFAAKKAGRNRVVGHEALSERAA